MSLQQFQYYVLIFIGFVAVIFALNQFFAWWQVNSARIIEKIVLFLTPKSKEELHLDEPHPDLIKVEARFKELNVVSAR